MFIRSFFLSIYFLFIFNGTLNAQTDEVKRGSYIYTASTLDILGTDGAETFADIIDIKELIEWEIHVPENYSPDNPPGVLIYISPQNRINIPRGWLNVTEENNLIWIAARKSGNKINVGKRVTKALLTSVILQSIYKIDTSRIYITGFSGGGRAASIVATQYPHLIKGAIYNCGVNFWGDMDQQSIEMVKNNRFVFITGTNDFNLEDTKSVFGKYRDAGVKNIDLMVVNRMGHENPSRNRLAQAIRYLDQR